MSTKEHLIEQHVREYESRLKHIDELYQRAQQAAAELDEENADTDKLKELAKQRELLQQTTEQVKSIPLDRWREETVRSAGPMAIWDILAQTLEDFVERHEK
jgi:DNA repair exonuclease SbcCD ATPase subunit